MNMGANGCSANCILGCFAENYEAFHNGQWDLVVMEPTVNNAVPEMNSLRALIATFSMQSPPPSMLILSASFRLDTNKDNSLQYNHLQGIEAAVSSFAKSSNLTFVSFPRYIFSMGLYNASNHRVSMRST